MVTLVPALAKTRVHIVALTFAGCSDGRGVVMETRLMRLGLRGVRVTLSSACSDVLQSQNEAEEDEREQEWFLDKEEEE